MYMMYDTYLVDHGVITMLIKKLAYEQDVLLQSLIEKYV